MSSLKEKIARKNKRHRSVRRRVSGSTERPRLCVYRSLKHIECQVIDDLAGRTLVSASSREPALKGELPHGGNVAAAKRVGQLLASRAREKGVTTVVLDRGGCRYHGRIKALAEAAREAGLKL